MSLSELPQPAEAPGKSAPYLSRRTFAIISHPDAGKTTLTEKLLFSGGAIRAAGQVRARGERRRARSDWMKIEQERGISVSSSVMTFERGGITFNLLDTPGHEDFSEDTYRTLTAVDAAIMVIDAAKGIETQTRKLFEVCRLRDIPIITFVNKIDREGRHPLEALDEIQEALALDVTPMTWPVGMGSDFFGVYDWRNKRFLTSSEGRGQRFDSVREVSGLEDPVLTDTVFANVMAELEENVELGAEAYPEFDREAFLEGHMTPVFFGSALRDYGIEEIIEFIAEFGPAPHAQPATARVIRPDEPKVSGFVFKVQANMDPKHRDRIAFVRLCSGTFKRGMKLKHVRAGKTIAVSAPIFFFAEEREIAETAYPGDVIGVPNHGQLRVGDTLTEGEEIHVTGLPAFAPEVLRRVRLSDTMRVKQMRQGLEDLAEEGLVQIFKPSIGSNWIVGVVGVLQLDVVIDRLKVEYQTEIGFDAVQYNTARWIECDDDQVLRRFLDASRGSLAYDRDDRPVFLFKNAWEVSYVGEKNPEIRFRETREIVHTPD
ncbi:peptide chain release factor 3 [Stappia taiwanensis]|uniref:Peptide chain release factor 3 n=1 Tax=Stappia taiwanensis TaxID=992267 RepID=A0A838XKV5_9HYPH|nr:peptide chain release factor 3 [Stappia taiwanensis]MBA4610772.1 peptide chain release factor 3 [Stappia taiwanensis]GGE95994.1 peptide chain release factor 3 [Stappia taiwanensis]